MKPILIAPVVALALAGGSAGAYLWATSEGSVEEAAVAQPTPTPTAITVPSPTPTAAPSPSPTLLPGGKAPNDCAPTESAYVDPAGRFAFCYLKDMELVTVDAGDGTTAVHVSHPTGQDDNRVTVSFGLRVEPYSPCGIDTMDIIKNQRVRDFVFAGRTVEACFRDHYDRTQPDLLRRKTIDFMVAAKGSDPLIVFASYGGPAWVRQGVPVEDIALRVLDSAAIY